MEVNAFRKQARARYAQHPTLLKTTLLNQAIIAADDDVPWKDEHEEARERRRFHFDPKETGHKSSPSTLLSLPASTEALPQSSISHSSLPSEIPAQSLLELLSTPTDPLQILQLCQHTPASLLILWYIFGPQIYLFAFPYPMNSQFELKQLLPSVDTIDNDTKSGRDSPLQHSFLGLSPLEPTNIDLKLATS